MRALLVDDEPSILLTLGLLLKAEGFDLQTANSAEAAKARLSETNFDVVVSDLSLEKPLSGYEVVHAANLQEIKPVTVVISAFPDSLAVWKEKGADAALQKPTDVQELLSTIEQLLREHHAGASQNCDA
jgi:two-component system response regulator GlrR